MKHYFLSSLCMFITILMHGISFSQQGNVWTFGVRAQVDFGTIPPTVGTSSISTYEGCASIADNAGNLIFYTDGQTVWDNTHTVVPGVLNGHWSTAQSGIIVPEPGTIPGSSTNRYYIFTAPQLGTGKVNFSIYNALTNSISNLNTPLPDDAVAANTTEGMTVARHCDGVDYWLITHEMGGITTGRFKAYRISNSGVSTPVNSDVGPAVPNVGLIQPDNGINGASCMKISPSNNRLAFIVRQRSVNLFDFNPGTGVISNHVTVISNAQNANRHFYGVEFSPNSNVLYYTDGAVGLYKYNISTPNTTQMANAGNYGDMCGALQLAPNGRIYMAKDNNSNMAAPPSTSLGVIDNPDNYSTSTYTAVGLSLAPGTGAKWGLPTIIPAFITPQITISGDSSICAGESTVLTASGGGATYTWSPATGLNTTTGASVIANPTSTQTYTVTSTLNGCTHSREVIVTVENCCFAAVDPVFTKITSDPHFNSHTVLSGKYYVAPGVEITVDGTTLDMTNVDMVFDECAGINFINDAKAIAYNSVFRPCNDTKSWLGFSFSSSSGNISESTFKNAQKAIRLEKTSSARITNNNFLNNQISIYVNDNTLSEAISGNKFTTNNLEVDYQGCGNTFGNEDAFALWARRGIFRDVISQNNFVNSDYNSAKRVYGIYLTEFSNNADISANTFTNQYVSIYASQSANLTVKNNTAEWTSLYTYPASTGQDVQFYFLKGTNGCTISENTLKGKPGYSNYGIYIDGSTQMSVNGNELNHFENCIQVSSSSNVEAINNLLENTTIGIHSYNTQNANFGCNVINCFKSSSVGILFDQALEGNTEGKITGNCIYNTNTAILLNKATAAGTNTIPFIANNFLYTYRTAGVTNTNFNGDIGSGLTGTTAGKNSFASNNTAGGAIDISSNTPLTSFGNYGITNINSNVTLTGNNTFHSTTSCSNQLGTALNQLSPSDFCQVSTGQTSRGFVSENGMLSTEFETAIRQFGKEDQILILKNTANELAAAATTNDMMRVQQVVLSSEISENDKLFILSELYTEQPAIGLAYLDAVQGMEELVRIEKINLLTLTTPMTSEQFTELAAIQESTSENREKAREALNVYGGRYPYRLENRSLNYSEVDQTGIISVSQNNLHIFPNPSSDVVSLQVSIPSNTHSILTITDLSGKTIMTREITEDFKEVELDVKTLRNGMYIVTVLQENNLLLTDKICVLH